MRAEDLVLQRLQESVDLTLLLPQALIRCLGGFAVTCFPSLAGRRKRPFKSTFCDRQGRGQWGGGRFIRFAFSSFA